MFQISDQKLLEEQNFRSDHSFEELVEFFKNTFCLEDIGFEVIEKPIELHRTSKDVTYYFIGFKRVPNNLLKNVKQFRSFHLTEESYEKLEPFSNCLWAMVRVSPLEIPYKNLLEIEIPKNVFGIQEFEDESGDDLDDEKLWEQLYYKIDVNQGIVNNFRSIFTICRVIWEEEFVQHNTHSIEQLKLFHKVCETREFRYVFDDYYNVKENFVLDKSPTNHVLFDYNFFKNPSEIRNYKVTANLNKESVEVFVRGKSSSFYCPQQAKDIVIKGEEDSSLKNLEGFPSKANYVDFEMQVESTKGIDQNFAGDLWFQKLPEKFEDMPKDSINTLGFVNFKQDRIPGGLEDIKINTFHMLFGPKIDKDTIKDFSNLPRSNLYGIPGMNDSEIKEKIKFAKLKQKLPELEGIFENKTRRLNVSDQKLLEEKYERLLKEGEKHPIYGEITSFEDCLQVFHDNFCNEQFGFELLEKPILSHKQLYNKHVSGLPEDSSIYIVGYKEDSNNILDNKKKEIHYTYRSKETLKFEGSFLAFIKSTKIPNSSLIKNELHVEHPILRYESYQDCKDEEGQIIDEDGNIMSSKDLLEHIYYYYKYAEVSKGIIQNVGYLFTVKRTRILGESWINQQKNTILTSFEIFDRFAKERKFQLFFDFYYEVENYKIPYSVHNPFIMFDYDFFTNPSEITKYKILEQYVNGSGDETLFVAIRERNANLYCPQTVQDFNTITIRSEDSSASLKNLEGLPSNLEGVYIACDVETTKGIPKNFKGELYFEKLPKIFEDIPEEMVAKNRLGIKGFTKDQVADKVKFSKLKQRLPELEGIFESKEIKRIFEKRNLSNFKDFFEKTNKTNK